MNKIAIIATLLLFLMVSCDNFLDVNTDPNFPTDVEPGHLIASAEGGLA